MKKNIDLNKLEILKMARELTINEYIDRRAQEHNEWLDKSAELWKTQRVSLAYPVIPPYPTEKEIIGRARALMEFLLIEEEPKEEIEDEEFENEVEYTHLQEVVNETIDNSFDVKSSDDKEMNKLPSVMKGLQDIKKFISDRKQIPK
jgi:hypothetical protein